MTTAYDSLCDLAHKIDSRDPEPGTSQARIIAATVVDYISQWLNGGATQWIENGYADHASDLPAWLRLAGMNDHADSVRAVLAIGAFDDQNDGDPNREPGCPWEDGDYDDWAIAVDNASDYDDFVATHEDVAKAVLDLVHFIIVQEGDF